MGLLNCDLLVIGAGPAGSSAALAASERKIKVLLIDRKREIGRPIQCGEWVPKLLLREIGLSARSVIQEVGLMRTVLPSGEWVDLPSPGYTIDRAIFDQELAYQASARGAMVMTFTRAIKRLEEGVLVYQNGRSLFIKAKVIVGADGPRSTTGSWLGQVNQNFVLGLQFQVPLRRPLGLAKVYFHQEIEGGYGWVFPKGEVANVGVGLWLGSKRKAVPALNWLLERLAEKGEILRGPILNRMAGLIPVGGPLDITCIGNIMLAGDAAGQADPVTGGGIPQAVTCGRIAGEVAAETVLEGNPDLLGKYEERWRDLWGWALDKARQKREYLDSHWHNGNFEETIKKSWIAFNGYGG